VTERLTYSGSVSLDAEGLLRDLTPPQREAVTTVDGPLLVIAAAGSGKTRVLTRRVAYLMSQGVAPGAILAITFTNKAAGEMKERVGKLLVEGGGRPLRDWGRLEPHQPTICTFHSLCMRILRYYGARVGLPGLTIFDTSDQLKVVKEALKLLDMSSTNFPPAGVLGTIGKAKNELKSPAQFKAEAGDFYQKQVARVYEKYQSMLEQQGALDFDDLLLRTVRAFKEHHDVLDELQDRFRYILIDEYQDTNHAQYVLSAALAMKYRNLCVVGDPDQSIYAWRGADISNILEFKKDYPDAKEVKLEHNYRSTKTILAVADKLIKNNSRRVDKRLITDNPDGEKVRLVLCQDEHDEADVVMRWLKKQQEGGMTWRQAAIFYRMNSLSRVMEDALRRAGIPYVMARGTAFYDRKEIKDVLAYLRVLANVLDEVSVERIVNTPPRGIGDTTVEKVRAYAVSRGISLFAGLCEADRVEGLSARARNAIRALVEQIRGWQGMARGLEGRSDGATERRSDEGGGRDAGNEAMRQSGNEGEDAEEEGGDLFSVAREAGVSRAHLSAAGLLVPEGEPAPASPEVRRNGGITALMNAIVKQSGLEAMYGKESKSGADTGSDPLANIEELITDAAEFDSANPEGTLEEYLTKTALVSDTDGIKEGAEGGGAVTMMTLHAAKGLEFPVVAMIGLEEGVLPHARARGNMDELEEERRLCFVGITRAQDKLLMTKAAYRTIRGLRERTVTSPFLSEMPHDRVELEDRAMMPGGGTTGGGRGYGGGGGGRYGPGAVGDSSDGSKTFNGHRFAVGMLVRHSAFGVGRIVSMSGSSSQTRCEIEFPSAGRKTIILEYARLEPVGG
jgi:DNA helicase-2/ATP-dependent DNA helicase PcrA